MPSTSYAFNDEQFSSTSIARLEKGKLRAMNDKILPFMADLESMGTNPETDGTFMRVVDWKVARHSQETAFVSGYEPLNMTVSPIAKSGWDNEEMIAAPAVIAELEERRNSGPLAIYDLGAKRLEDVHYYMRSRFHTQLLKGAVGPWTGINTLNGIDNSDGFLEHDALLSQANLLHNVSKATYATQLGFQNQIQDVAGSFSSNGLSAMFKLQAQCEEAAPADQAPKHMWYQRLDSHVLLKKALNTNEHYLTEKEIDGGKRVLAFGGVPIKIVSELPNAGNADGSVTTSATSKMSAILLDWNCFRFQPLKKGNFFTDGWVKRQDGYLVRFCPLIFHGQTYFTYLGSSGVLLRADA